MERDICYSDCRRESFDMQKAFKCDVCQKCFHNDCLKSGKPSPLVGDVFFDFTCADCSETGQETFIRMKLPWLPILMLVLYNLQLSSTGCQGYFRWREHICDFIEKHWTVLFVRGRRKTQTWYGTVAGTLSIGCPTYFLSGMEELKQSGWWKLTDNSPPTLDIMNASSRFQKKEKKTQKSLEESAALSKPASLRRRLKQSSIQAAIELKAKHDIVTKHLPASKSSAEGGFCDAGLLDDEPDETSNIDPMDDECASVTTDLSQTSGNSYSAYDCLDQSSQMSKSSCRSDGWLTEKDLVVCPSLPAFLMKDEGEEELILDPCSLSPRHLPSPSLTTSAAAGANSRLPPLEDILACFDSPVKDDWNISSVSNETSPLLSCRSKPLDAMIDKWSQRMNHKASADDEDEDWDPNESPSENNLNTESSSLSTNADTARKRKRRQEMEDEAPATAAEPQLVQMSLYEEKQLLKKFRSHDDVVKLTPSLRRLRRKLIVREQQREHGALVFDLDLFMNQLNGSSRLPQKAEILAPTSSNRVKDQSCCGLETTPLLSDDQVDDFRILDRYQTTHLPHQKPHSTLFINRLVGADDLSYVYSPYTARSLKPFIQRDYKCHPLKLRLLQEITAYYHRKDPDWKPAPAPPLDFCYVRPQHIPSVNALCKEFFWPGIDLSECLQYPDFSCVALYRKFVVGFAFMVPDVKYNEAYISFIFTHPEWRRCNIASFMLYHLIQTSMGKEITLHVSASNPALLLYQKFGFKVEEFILDFYDKYFPLESTECRHALFMRLRR